MRALLASVTVCYDVQKITAAQISRYAWERKI